jgi:hypothetical protein
MQGSYGRTRAASQAPSSSDAITFAVTTFKQRDQWSRRMPRIPGLTPLYRDVLRSLALCTRTDKDGKLVIDPTHAELARAAGCSEPTAYRVVAKAVEIGVIRKARHSDGRVSNSYELMLPNSAANGAKEPEKAPEKTQEFQRPTLSEMPASKPSNPITTGQGLKVESKEEAKNTDRATYEERAKLSLTVTDRPPVLPREETLPASQPTNRESAKAARLVESKTSECKIEKPVSNGSHFFTKRAIEQIDDGGAAKRRFQLSVRTDKPEEITTMPKPAPDPAVIAADDAFFAMLIETYPRRDGRDRARAAYHDAVSESDNPAQVRCLILDRAIAYEAEMRAKGSTLFDSLAAFIEDGSWRAENLPFNRAAA